MPAGFPGAPVPLPRDPCPGVCDDADTSRSFIDPINLHQSQTKYDCLACNSRAKHHAMRVWRWTALVTLIGVSRRQTAMPSASVAQTEQHSLSSSELPCRFELEEAFGRSAHSVLLYFQQQAGGQAFPPALHYIFAISASSVMSSKPHTTSI